MKIFLCILITLFVSFLGYTTSFAQEGETPPPDSPIMDQGEEVEIETFGPGSVDEEVPEVPSAPAQTPAAEQEGQAPGTIQGAAPGVYTIVEGDNLWDICTRFLGNPFEWPKLWSINEYITNPHFIYPGGRLVFKPGTETTPPSMEFSGTKAEAAQIPEEETAPADMVEKIKEEAPPSPLVAEAKEEPKVYRVILKSISFLTPKELEGTGMVQHSPEAKRELTGGDKLYLKFKKPEGVSINDRFVVIETIDKVNHPRNGKFMGYQTYFKANIKVVAIDKRVFTAIILDCEKPVNRGDRIVPYRDPIRKVIPKDLDKEVNGYLVASEPEHKLIGQQEFAYVDRGKKQGLDDGTILYIVRRGDSLLPINDKKLPLIIVGKALVIEARENTSTVYIMDANKDIELGDVIKTKI